MFKKILITLNHRFFKMINFVEVGLCEGRWNSTIFSYKFTVMHMKNS